MSVQKTEKPRKTTTKSEPSEESKKRKILKDEIKSLNETVKAKKKELDSLVPVKEKKKRLVLSETMKIAQSTGKKVAELSDEEKDELPADFRSKCAKIVGLKSLNEMTRGQVDAVAKASLSLLETMPKPEKKAKSKETDSENSD